MSCGELVSCPSPRPLLRWGRGGTGVDTAEWLAAGSWPVADSSWTSFRPDQKDPKAIQRRPSASWATLGSMALSQCLCPTAMTGPGLSIGSQGRSGPESGWSPVRWRRLWTPNSRPSNRGSNSCSGRITSGAQKKPRWPGTTRLVQAGAAAKTAGPRCHCFKSLECQDLTPRPVAKEPILRLAFHDGRWIMQQVLPAVVRTVRPPGRPWPGPSQ